MYFRSLDSEIGPDDPVRLFDEVLEGIDWSSWEAAYPRKRGQPPIHPRHLAAAMLYGMYRGIRSSRRLEEACTYRLDFIWLVEGRRIDHTTFAKFRTRFREPLKDLFRQIGRTAMNLGMIRLCEVAFDGTRVKANNSRYKTRTAKTLAEKLAALDELFDEMVADVRATDNQQRALGSPTHLPDELREVAKRREEVEAALKKAQAADEARRQQGVNPEKNPAQVPTTDPDSKVMPNKEGGYAPNYTPVATTDGHLGFIVDVDVLAEVNESTAAVPAVDRIKETFGRTPEAFLTDCGNNSGQVIEQMEERGIEFYAPVQSSEPQEGNPAKRDDRETTGSGIGLAEA
jgi:transposase